MICDFKVIDAHATCSLTLYVLQLITAKLIQVGSNMPSSPDSSSDSSAGSPHHTFDGPNIEAENCLPGVVRPSLCHRT